MAAGLGWHIEITVSTVVIVDIEWYEGTTGTMATVGPDLSGFITDISLKGRGTFCRVFFAPKMVYIKGP